MEILGISFDPVALTMIAGVIWPLLQASFDQPRWTARVRLAILIGAGAAATTIVWIATAYPAHWATVATAATGFIGAATTAFALLKRIGLIDWIGRITPGGEPRHRLDPTHASAAEIANRHRTAAPHSTPGHRPRQGRRAR